MLTVVDADGMTPNGSLIDEIVWEGARRMLAAALEAEIDGYLAELAEQRGGEHGRRLVVRNGFHAGRTIATSAGPVRVKAPRVNDRRVDAATGERRRFSSAILPPWARKTPKIAEVLPLLYLHGLSTGDFGRGMRATVLAIGDGALGFWKALREAFPETREQRCWVHQTANVLDSLPKSAQPAAKNALADIYNAEDKDHAATAVRAVAKQYAARFPKAVAKVIDDQAVLLAFYDYPAEHWIHLRTTNPIESTFSTVRLRTKVTRGAGSGAAALAMTFKLIESAQQRWRAVNAPHLAALVRSGARFEKGVLVEREQVTVA